MHRQFLMAGLVLSASLVRADDGPTLPKAEMLPAPRRLALPVEQPVPSISLSDWHDAIKKLREERDALTTESAELDSLPSVINKDSDENARLRQRVQDLVNRMQSQKSPVHASAPAAIKPPSVPPPPKDPPPPPPSSEKKTEAVPLDLTQKNVDPLVLGHALFKAKNYEASLRTYRLIELQGKKAEDRAPIQYLMASCLKKLGKTEEAAGLFREVANSKGDEYLALCAQWQLSTIRWQREMTDTLKEVHRRVKTLEVAP